MSRDVFVASARRTPIGKFLGALADVPAVELGAAAAKAALADAGVAPSEIGLVVFGHARQAGNGPNPARQVLQSAGVPLEVPAFTVNQACASGLQALALGAQAIRTGEADAVLVGGMESMSRVPYLLDRGRAGYRLGDAEIVDAMYRDGFLCPLCGELMGETAEALAEKYAISRREQDEYAVESQRRAAAADFSTELAPVKQLARDEHVRPDATVEKMAKLEPVFRKNGTVHAGNSSGITDGAAALVLTASPRGKQLAKVVGEAHVGLEPRFMGLGPVPATEKLFKKIGWKLSDVDLIELNEAFAAQVLACRREMNFDAARTNVRGGAIALGHPIGATGARIGVTLLHELKRRNARRGLATLCVSGGLGMSVAFEAI